MPDELVLVCFEKSILGVFSAAIPATKQLIPAAGSFAAPSSTSLPMPWTCPTATGSLAWSSDLAQNTGQRQASQNVPALCLKKSYGWP